MMKPLYLSVLFLVFAVMVSVVAFTKKQGDSIANNAQTKTDQAIISGADPTDLLAPTASGHLHKGPCNAGLIAGDIDSNEYSKVAYASIKQGGVTYIQVSRYMPTYLTQQSYQTVSATEINTPPVEVKRALEQRISNPEKCVQEALYLSSIQSISTT